MQETVKRKKNLSPQAKKHRLEHNIEYQKENCKQFALKLNINTDSDIIEFMKNLDNKQGFIKELLRNEIKKLNRN